MTEDRVGARPEPQIIEATRRAVEKHGYGGLSLERIALEAGVSRVTLHRRGFSTEEIFDVLVDQTMAEQRDALWPVLASDGSGAERLRLGLGLLCDRCERDLDVMVAIGAQTDARRHVAGIVVPSSTQSLVEPLQILFREGVNDGSLRDSDLEESAMLLLTSVVTTYVRLRSAFGWKRKRTREAVIEQSLAAFAPVVPLAEA